MSHESKACRTIHLLALVCLGCVAGLLAGAGGVSAAPPEAAESALPAQLTASDAVAWALQHNPELAAFREQHGCAAAAVVIAETYPFNPIWDGKVRPAFGPASAGVTNVLSNEHKLLIDVELRGQGSYRRQSAAHALKRTDWEIANQEVVLAIRVLRAYSAVLYRLEKIQVIKKTIAVNEKAVSQVEALVKAVKLRQADRILVQTELQDARAQMASGYSALVPAWQELRRSLGVVEERFQPMGSLQARSLSWDPALLAQAAQERRPDLHARQSAVAESDAKVRLAVADRFGNPNVGPAFEYDPTRITLIGAQFTLPLPVFNTRRGEILQREAERNRAILDLRQTEVLVRQDVRAALARSEQAKAWLKSYRNEVVPGLEASLKEMSLLLDAGEPGVSAVQLIDINRKLLKAVDVALDARWEAVQAEIDLAAAVGEPALAIAPEAMAKELGLKSRP
jgi:cobalt-zinc-cadmium efflux system outer membrane protein